MKNKTIAPTDFKCRLSFNTVFFNIEDGGDVHDYHIY